MRRSTAVPLAARQHAPLRDWLFVASQIALITGIELGDDAVHALAPQANAAPGQANALRVVAFERSHGFWVEPGLQRFFTAGHQLFGHTIGWTQVHPLLDALYGQGHVFFTLAFAIWAYFRRRPLFPFLRTVFVLTGLLAVAGYEAFPLAPPRLAQGLTYQGHPYHFLDAVFGSGGIQLSFNEYAAMPSLHVAWALIVGLTMWWTARPWMLRILGLCYPPIMVVTVIVTGNHYVLDGMGAVVIVALAALGAAVIAAHARRQSLTQTVRMLQALRYQRAERPIESTPVLPQAGRRRPAA